MRLRFELLVWSGNDLIQRIHLAPTQATPHTGVVSRQAPETVGSERLASVVERYALWCRARGKAERYVAQVERLIRRVAEALGWGTLQDLAAGGLAFEDHLTSMDASAKTRNNVLCAVRAFADWLRRREEIPSNPFDRIELTRHFAGSGSRALSAPEMAAMIATAEADEALSEAERRSGYIRSPWYRIARATGLRALEMERVRVGAVQLDEGRACITIQAKDAKGRRTQRIPLADGFVPWIRAYIGNRDPLDRLMMSPRPRKWVMDGDAKKAGISGLKVGLHSFRKGLVTALAASGAPMSVTQEIARHTDPRLTQAVYVDANLLPLRDAINALAAAGYGESSEKPLESPRAADSMDASRHPMNKPKTNPSGPREAGESPQSSAALTPSVTGDPASLGRSGISCGGHSTEQAQHWARQDSNLLRPVASMLAAAADLIRAVTSPRAGGSDVESAGEGCGGRGGSGEEGGAGGAGLPRPGYPG